MLDIGDKNNGIHKDQMAEKLKRVYNKIKRYKYNGGVHEGMERDCRLC